MKLNEIREIVDFMKENGLSELEYKERHTSIRLKLAPPAPPATPWERFKAAAAPVEAEAAEEERSTEEEAEPGLDVDLDAAAAKVRDTAAKAGSAVFDTVKAGASFLKSKKDEYLAGGTPGAYDVELEDEEDAESEPAPQEEPVAAAPEAESADTGDAVEDVTLDTDAAKAAVSKTAEAVINTAKAGASLGVAGLRRGRNFIMDLLNPSGGEAAEEEPAEAPEAEEPTEETPEE